MIQGDVKQHDHKTSNPRRCPLPLQLVYISRWSHQAPQFQPCLQDCARCGSATTCDACAANRVIDVGGGYSRQNLNPSLVRFDHRDMGLPFSEPRGGGSTRNNRIQAARRMLVDGDPPDDRPAYFR